MRVNPTKLLVTDFTEVADKTASGIFIPTLVIKTDNMKGRVVITGEGTPDVKVLYKEGEVVLYHPRAGQKFTYEDKEYRLIDVSDVFIGGL
jgi:co-chaperonin GroES (HSP10)